MFKTINVGSLDRLVRIIVGAILIASPYFLTSDIWTNPYLRWGVFIVGAILIFTALVRFCPLYRLIGASTCKTS